jgi:hypothetical protein
MSDPARRLEAVAAIEALGYQCVVADDGGRSLITVEHPATDGAAVEWTVLQEDRNAVSAPS